MTTSPDISVVFTDGAGTTYDLTTTLFDFDRMRLGEEKILPVVLQNNSGKPVRNITVEAVAHPTEQSGDADETYDAVQIGETDSGPWFNILSIPLMSVDEEKTIYLNWTMPEQAIPGLGVFAIQCIGDVEL